ncbi:MAG: calcium/sodium antiporter [Pseudorhodoplanes sp.]|uniref:calcium/sodium antiporter n=1 Tax=Pseudorhodoplanes sp. TaxID=1934341 RepID=UPI003D0F92D4
MEKLFFFIAGLVFLIGGAQLLVSGAVQIAQRLGVSALLIGLLIGFGTSTPELVTSVSASLAGAPGVALGNIVGANITNLLLVLGVCALLRPIHVGSRSLRFDGAVVFTAILVFTLLSIAAPLSRPVGAAYVALLALYIFRSIQIERRKPKDHTAPYERGEAGAEVIPSASQPAAGPGSLALSVSQIIGGIALVVLGAQWLVDAAVDLARGLQVSESVIGLTVVAIGTTLPELVTSVAATLRKNTDVALGNVFGSCIYNVFGIAGATGLIAPTVYPMTIAHYGNPVMVAVAGLVIGLAWTGYRISQREATLMLVLYASYVFFIWQS